MDTDFLCSLRTYSEELLTNVFGSVKKPLLFLGAGVTGAFAVVTIYRTYRNILKRNRRKQWAKFGKDKVVLHQVNRGSVIPSPSPFVMKLETYLRVAKIPYESDFEEPFGPKGKTPWITINGEEFTDSQLCIEMLGRKFEKNLSSHLSPVEQSIARAFQSFGTVAFCLHRGENRKSVDSLASKILHTVCSPTLGKRCSRTGNGSPYSEADAIEIGLKDLRAMSNYLGSKPYFMGEKATEVDYCALFGMLAQVVWAEPGSLYEQLLNYGEFINLKRFCERMKTVFWPDWDECLFRPKALN